MPVLVWLLFVLPVLALSSLDALVILPSSEDSGDSYWAAAPALAGLRRGRGRPRKFATPSRTVSLTLPESVIATLSALHDDLSQAVVRLAERQIKQLSRKGAELLVFGRRAVITIRPTRSLELRAGVQLVPLPDGRALISFRDPTSLAALQLSIADALEDTSLDGQDRAVYENLSEILREARQSDDVSLEQRHIIVLESTRAPRSNGKTNGARRV